MEIFSENSGRMKSILLLLFVVFLTVVVAVPSNRHKKHKTNAVVKEEEEPTTVPDFDFQWPDPDHVNDFEVPEAFRLGHGGRKDSGDAITKMSPSSANQHGRSKHRSHSH